MRLAGLFCEVRRIRIEKTEEREEGEKERLLNAS
jgi:hypothetical protein